MGGKRSGHGASSTFSLVRVGAFSFELALD